MKAIDWSNKYSSMPRITADDPMSMLRRKYPHIVAVKLGSRQAEIDEWINDVLGNEKVVQVGAHFFFEDDTEAMQFKLVWR